MYACTLQCLVAGLLLPLRFANQLPQIVVTVKMKVMSCNSCWHRIQKKRTMFVCKRICNSWDIFVRCANFIFQICLTVAICAYRSVNRSMAVWRNQSHCQQFVWVYVFTMFSNMYHESSSKVEERGYIEMSFQARIYKWNIHIAYFCNPCATLSLPKKINLNLYYFTCIVKNALNIFSGSIKKFIWIS